MNDYYGILGVDVEASAPEIEQAYRTQVRRHHPDLHPDDTASPRRFQQIQEAFDTLHDPLRRENYDLARHGPASRPYAIRPEETNDGEAYADELDALRFVRRPGTALIPYRGRPCWETLAEWVVDSDFLLPLAVVTPLLGIHVVCLTLEMLRAAWR